MIRRGSVVVLAALCGAVAAAAWHTAATLRHPPSVTSRKLAEAERITYYRITADDGPRFLLSGAEATLRLVTHVRLPPDAPYDPLRRIRYGVRVTVRDAAGVRWEREIFTQSRQSKAVCVRDARAPTADEPCAAATYAPDLDLSQTECAGGQWRCENAFARDDRVQLSDDRLLHIHLPDDIPPDAVLSITLIGDAVEGVVRVYNQVERSPEARARAARVAEPGRQAMWTTTYLPWSMVSIAEREGLLRHGHARMSAIGEDGVDYHTRVVYYTGFRLPLDSLTENEAIEVHHRRNAALNLVGPADVALLVDTFPAGEDAPDDAAVELAWVSARIQPAPELASPALARPADASAAPSGGPRPPPASPPRRALGIGVHRLHVPAGLHSLHIRTRSIRPLGVQVVGPRRGSFGAPPDVGDERGPLRPDDIRVPVALTDPDADPITLPGSGGDDPMSRVIRIEVRWIDDGDGDDAAGPGAADEDPAAAEDVPASGAAGRPGDAAEAAAAAPLSGELVVALHGDGQVLRQVLPGVRAPYEWLDRTGLPPAGVSEPIEVDLIVPEHVGRVRVSTSRPAALRLLRYVPGERLYELPYRAVELASARWRYARIERRRWWPMSPLDQEALAANDRLATLVAQARLEPLPRRPRDADDPRRGDAFASGRDAGAGDGLPGTEHVSASGVAIEPLDAPERHMVIEPVAHDAPLDQWSGGMVSAVPLGRGARYRFAAGAAQRARLHYWLDPADLGAEIAIAVDGRPVAALSPATTQGYYELPLVTPGVHELVATTRARSLSLYISRPPADRHVPRYGMRWVHALDGGHLRLRVVKHAGKPVIVNMVVYGPWHDAPPGGAIRVVISGARPLRTPGLWPSGITIADRRVPLPAARGRRPVPFTDRDSGAAGYARTIPIRLGDDIQPGTHYIDVYANYAGRLWARFFVIDGPRDPRDRALQWRFRAPRDARRALGAGGEPRGTPAAGDIGE